MPRALHRSALLDPAVTILLMLASCAVLPAAVTRVALTPKSVALSSPYGDSLAR
jgi:hypothetical protein